MSSMRSRIVPPSCAAARAVNRAENACPRCSRPLGLGAKRKIGLVAIMSPRKSSASTTAEWLKERLDTPALLALHLDALVALDPRLGAVWARAGQVELRTAPKGFTGIIRVICGQQLSTSS